MLFANVSFLKFYLMSSAACQINHTWLTRWSDRHVRSPRQSHAAKIRISDSLRWVRPAKVCMSALRKRVNTSDWTRKKSVDVLPASWLTYCFVTWPKTSESHLVDRVSEMKRREYGEGGESDGGMIGLNKDRKKGARSGERNKRVKSGENGR